MTTSFCPECRRMTPYAIIERPDTFTIRGDDVTVDARVAVCLECNQEIGDETLDDITLLSAYSIYRARHGMLQPAQIAAIRSKYGLGQKAFARLLGWGDVTVSRYERGSLQSEGHDRTLRLVEDPENARRLLGQNADRLSPEQRTTVEGRLSVLATEPEGLLAREDAAAYSAGPAARKLREMMVFFSSKPTMWRTRLSGSLFYSDFLHYRRLGTSISDCRYVHMQLGPMPVDFYTLQGALVEDTSIAEHYAQSGGCEGTVFVASRPADLSGFGAQEIATMEEVAHRFNGWGARQISEFSQTEPAWLETKDRETIPYEYAARLQIQ